MSQFQTDIALEINGICKTFPGVIALDHVSFKVKKGEVHGLVGENGAGKSTLIKILSGVYSAESGELVINGKKAHISSPIDSLHSGIQVMHQEISVMPNMTVAENILIYDLPRKFGFYMDDKIMNARARELLDSVGLYHISPTQKVGSLSLANQQMIHLARIVSTNPSVILLDEPTASLTSNEAKELFAVIQRFKQNGVAVIYISHYLDEVISISDQITVLRDGRHITTVNSKSVSSDDIVTAMIGHQIKKEFRKPEVYGNEVLRLTNVTTATLIRNINLCLRQREVLGLYGLGGAGKTETMRAITGLDSVLQGTVSLFNTDVTHSSIAKKLRQGLAFIPEDRRRQGLVLQMNVQENASLGGERKYAFGGILRKKFEANDIKTYVKKMRIKSPSMQTQVSVLSGGNQQKVIMARCLAHQAKVFLLDEPTVGIDVGARGEIYQLISEIVQEGSSVLLASSDINEIMQTCDRVVVLSHGRVAAVLDRKDCTEEKLLMYAMGMGEENNEKEQFA